MTSLGRNPLGNDDTATAHRELLADHLRVRGLEVDLHGPGPGESGQDYPDVAVAVDKVPDVRAAQAADTYSAERARKSNDAQILTIGARTVPELARSIVDAWLASEFEAGRSAAKVAKLKALGGSRIVQGVS
jgi:ribose 5-phosphate isomerase B